MIHFMLRNLKVFYKDKSSVFFSMLAVLIIIVLYFAFWETPLARPMKA